MRTSHGHPRARRSSVALASVRHMPGRRPRHDRPGTLTPILSPVEFDIAVSCESRQAETALRNRRDTLLDAFHDEGQLRPAT